MYPKPGVAPKLLISKHIDLMTSLMVGPGGVAAEQVYHKQKFLVYDLYVPKRDGEFRIV